MPIDLTRISRIIEAVIRIPGYALVGEASNKIIMLSSLEGEVSLWAMDYRGKELRRLTREPITDAARPDKDSPYVVFTRDVAKGMELEKLFMVDLVEGVEKPFAEMEPLRIFGFVHHGDTVVYVGATMQKLAIYEAEAGKRPREITTLRNIAFVTDFNDKYIVGSGPFKGDPRSTELFIIDRETNELKVYTPKEGSNNKFPVLVGDKLLFESNLSGENKLYLYSPADDTLEEVSFSYSDYLEYKPVEHGPYGALDDGRIWVVGKKNGRMKLFIDGRQVNTPDGTIHGYPVITRGRAYVALSNMVTPTRIYSIDLEEATQEIIVDNRMPEEIEQAIGGREFVKYRSFDGLEIPMYIAYTSLSPRPGPAIVYVHGGPWSEIMDVFSRMIISLVAAGYHVLAPNFRGSTGYGDGFRVLDIGDPGGGDLEDIVYAAKYGLEKCIASKVAVMGYSYGGYMTYMALGKKPEIWSAGVAGAGVVDWEEMYGLSDQAFKQFIEMLFAGKKELWKERSPITYVENVKAPLCIIHSQNDTRTPLKPVLRYMDKLLEHGKTFEAHIAPDMGHVITRMDDAVKILLPALIFLEKYLKG